MLSYSPLVSKIVVGVALVVFVCFVAAIAVTASQPYPALPEVFPSAH